MSEFYFRMPEDRYNILLNKFNQHAVLFDHEPTKIFHRPDNGDRVVGLFVVGTDYAQDVYKVKDFGLIRVTQHWIPVDSHPESSTAWKLVAEHRCFEKPLRPNVAGYKHDFLLLDADFQANGSFWQAE